MSHLWKNGGESRVFEHPKHMFRLMSKKIIEPRHVISNNVAF